MRGNRCMLAVEALESRSLLSLSGLLNPSPAVQADLAKIVADQQTLIHDITSQGATLQKDVQGLISATQAAYQNDPAVHAAFMALTTDTRTFQSTLVADYLAILQATSANRAAAVAKFQSDASNAAAVLQADQANIQTAVNNDAAVVAARAQLQADATKVATDIALLQADFAQLKKDLNV